MLSKIICAWLMGVALPTSYWVSTIIPLDEPFFIPPFVLTVATIFIGSLVLISHWED